MEESPQSINQEKEEGEMDQIINIDNNINNENQNPESNMNAPKIEKLYQKKNTNF